MRVEPLPLTLEEQIMELLRTHDGMTVRSLIVSIYGNIDYNEFKSKRNIVNKIMNRLIDDDKVQIVNILNHGAFVYDLRRNNNGQDA